MKVTVRPSLHASWIDRDAIDIVKRLQSKGFQTYLVGGCVRDLLCEVHPKDYDIATNALPNEVRKLIHGSYVIGKRFRLVLVKRGDQQFEVATFRRSGRPEDFVEGEDAPVGDNFFGTAEEDAIRRDFSMNALFYDPIKEELIDYPSGLKDIQNRVLKMIGEPVARLQEDPIRTLRALRLSHKLRFKIDEDLRKAMADHADLLAKSVLPRRREEYLKILRLADPCAAFLEMWDLGLIQHCLPTLMPIFSDVDRQSTFLGHLRRMKEFVVDASNPVELYAAFVLAIREAMHGLNWSTEVEEAFYRLEMGVFKAEWAEIESAIHFQERLRDTDHFRRRGFRRQQAFLQHPSLPAALRLAAYQYLLPAETLKFWQDRLNGIPMPPRAPGQGRAHSQKSPEEIADDSGDSLTEDSVSAEAAITTAASPEN